jgi:glycosyltransferase involved in cell wall biosynthesis
VFVSPSVEEGWGIAVGEALIAGVPSVVYELPAYSHFGDLPLLAPLGDIEGFVDTVVGLLTDRARLDAERRRIEHSGDRLPRWNDLLASEVAAMDALSADSGAGSRGD